jgi:acetoin utilization deacetylase AcuC-like enzyme
VTVSLYYDDIFLEHHAPDHPERPERLTAIVERLRGVDQAGLTWRGAADLLPDEILELVHPGAFWQSVRQMSATGGGWLDPDTYCTSASYAVARRAAGTSVECAVRVCDDRQPGFALIRPPGHHASATHAMGFCLMNNIAVAARAAQQRDGIDRVAIIDIDVHHGNGTQDIFIEDPSVLYCSLHQSPFYPGTGGADVVGRGAGRGTTVNVPLPAGTDGTAWLDAFDRSIPLSVQRFQPDLILVSAGFDGHAGDPLAEFDVTTEVYGEIADRIAVLAGATRSVASAWFLEGGYALEPTADSCALVVSVLRNAEDAPPSAPGGRPLRHGDRAGWPASDVHP